MIQLKQNQYNFGNIQNILQKYGMTELKIDSSLIEDDILRMKRMINNAKNKSDEKNIKNIIKYLDTLKSKINEDEKYEITWILDKFTIKGYPINIKNINEYGIRPCEYVELENKQRFIRIDYSNVFQCIAFEMMYKDFGYSFDEIEEELKDIGISVINPIDRIQKYLDENALKYSKVLRIGDSSYASDDGKLAWDYFYSAWNEKKQFTGGNYKDPVNRSIDIAIVIITKSILNNFIAKHIDFKICSLGEDGLYFIVEGNDEDIAGCIENCTVRAFGRKFEAKPSLEIL